jgi:nucleoside-diphosphate-sugar epimerase
MEKSKNILVCGAGGFIGGHLAKKFILEGFNVTCVDVKPFELWFQLHENSNNLELDLQDLTNCETSVKNQDYVFNMACNMGGIGFIEWNKAKCMLSVLINTHLLKACKNSNVEKYFFSSSACAYNTMLQENTFIEGLKEEDAYPAFPEDGYGWEKLFSERMCRHFYEDFKLDTKVARYHNIFGPIGTFDGGREKSPAALCRKVANAKINKTEEIEVWGDGKQTRSYLYIDDCVEATINLFNSDINEPINIGSEEQVSINQMLQMIENIADYKVKKIYNLEMPVGVRGRSSNNDKIKKELGWEPNFSLFNGLEKTYNWIFDMLVSKSNNKSIFTKS